MGLDEPQARMSTWQVRILHSPAAHSSNPADVTSDTAHNHTSELVEKAVASVDLRRVENEEESAQRVEDLEPKTHLMVALPSLRA